MTPPVAGKAGIVRRGRLSDVKSCKNRRKSNTRPDIEDVLRHHSAPASKARKCIIREVLHKVTNKMASSGQTEDPTKSPTTNKEDVTVSKSKTDEKESPIVPLVNENSRLNSADVKMKNDSMSEQNITTEDRKDADIREERKDTDNVENQNKHDLRSLIIDKNEQDDDKKDQEQEETKEEIEKQEAENMSTSPHPQGAKDTKDSNQDGKESSVKTAAALKRKRKSQSSSISPVNSPVEESVTRSKRKKLKSTSDRFCWRCHKEPVDVYCTACPRSWHRRCIGGTPPSPQKWICGECANILTAENAETRSTAMAQLSVDQLCMLLKHVVERLRGYPGSEPFCKPVDLTEVPNYMDYVIKPMDLSLLEYNVRSKLYGSTEAFMADAKWIQHNCIVFNTCGGVYADTSKLTNAAKQIIKVARSEVSEIEACPDCYAHSRNLPRPQPTWFIEPCRRPHPLVWAKLKGFPFWPAKAMPRVNSQGFVDVRFFGEHDRAWVSPKDLYLYSEEPPAPSSRKRKSDMDECVREITRHCRKLELMFGQFKFAPPKVQYNPNDPTQITLMLPNYNPTDPNNRPIINVESFESRKKMLPRKRSPHKDKLQNDESIHEENKDIPKESVNGDSQEKKDNEATTRKVQKLDFDDAKDISNSENNFNSDHDKLSENQEVALVAQNKAPRDRAKRAKTPLVKNNENDNVPSPNRTISDKNTLQKAKNEVKLVPEQLSESIRGSEVTRVRKKNSAKNVSKRTASQSGPKSTKNPAGSSKIYKPKKQMVDKLNAEKALKPIPASKENNRLTTNTSRPVTKKNKDSAKKIPELDTTLSSSAASSVRALPRIQPRPTVHSTNLEAPVSFTPSTDSKSVLFLVVNNGTTAEVAKQQTATIVTDYPGNTVATVQREAKDTRESSPQKKESKAKKTFPNKGSRGGTQLSPRVSATATEFSTQVSTAKSNTTSNTSSSSSSNTYQMLPPEAGPISARLHHNAQELARRMGQLMEEAYKEAAEAGDGNGESSTADNYQATIFFLRMQIEHMKWQHQQQMAELKHNADRTMREMRASLEAEKLRSVQEARREVEEDKVRCIEETKRKQWCAKCGQEALFYCCWNTAYCDYPCQQMHWPMHMRTCSQQPAFTTIVTSSSNANSQAQNDNNTQGPPGRVYALPRSKLSGISSSWSTSSLTNKAKQDSH